MSTQQCCQQIDNSNNKWIDCRPCEEAKLRCELLQSQSVCQNPESFGKYCVWMDNKCVNSSSAPPFAKSIHPCYDDFSPIKQCYQPSMPSGPLYWQTNPLLFQDVPGALAWQRNSLTAPGTSTPGNLRDLLTRGNGNVVFISDSERGTGNIVSLLIVIFVLVVVGIVIYHAYRKYLHKKIEK